MKIFGKQFDYKTELKPKSNNVAIYPFHLPENIQRKYDHVVQVYIHSIQ